MWLSTNHINHNLQGTTKGVVHAVPSFPLYAHCIYASYSICFLSVFGPTSQFFVSSLFSAPRLNLLYVVCFRPQVWIFCTKSIFGPTSEFLDLVSQLILRDLYRAKYAGSCPRIAQIFPNFPKWNIFLNQKVVIPERFGRVHTTLQSTYYQEVPMRKKKIEVLQMLDGEPIWLVLCLMGWFCLTVFRTSMVWFGLLSLFTDAWPVSGCLELVSPSLSLAYILFHTNGWLEPIYNGDHGRGFQTMVLSCHPFWFLSVWVGWFL